MSSASRSSASLGAASLEAAATKLQQKGVGGKLWQSTFETFTSSSRFDLIHCLLSTFKYIQTEKDAIEHLRQCAQQLVKGGLYVLGIHLTDYNRTRNQVERWDGKGRDYSVISRTWTEPPNRRTRSEKLRNRLRVRFSSAKKRPDLRLETEWVCRTYDARQLKRLLGKIPELNCVACFDFTYDLASPRELDDSQEDVVLILVKS